MTAYVDELRRYPEALIKRDARRYGGEWCHLTADTETELHAFAARLGLKRAWFQGDYARAALRHYDLVPSKRAMAIRLGAVAVESREHLRSRVKREIAAERS